MRNLAAAAVVEVIAAQIQSDGICWLGTGLWKGQTVLRVSISNWLTTQEDIATALDSLSQAVRKVEDWDGPSGN